MPYLSASLVLLSDLMFLKYYFKYIFFQYLKALLAVSQTQSKIQPGQYIVWFYSSLLVPPSLLHHLLNVSLTHAPTYSALRLPGAFWIFGYAIFSAKYFLPAPLLFPSYSNSAHYFPSSKSDQDAMGF